MELNRTLLFNGLMVAVAAPYLYTLSESETNMYFRFGLKMLAGVVAASNLLPLLQASAPLVEAAQALQAQKEAEQQALQAKTIQG